MISDLRPRASKLFNALLDIVLPMHCMGCGRDGAILCAQCLERLPRLELPFCDICADPGVNGVCGSCQGNVNSGLLYIDGIRAPYLMEGLVRDAVHGFKYRNYRVAAPVLASALAHYLGENPMPGDILVPVPLHKRKLRERGYNQAWLLARELARRTGIPSHGGLLARTRYSRAQALSANRQQRRENIEDAFECRANVAGKDIILVDDVCTTGNTLDACARVLKEAGAKSVRGIVVAREEMRVQ